MAGTYIAVLKARASAVFYPGESFSLNYAPQEAGACRLTFRTTFGTGFEVPHPIDLWVEARGQATNLHSAAERFGNAALAINCLVALAANADMGDLQMELIFDASEDAEEHEFLQTFVGHRPVTVVPGRRVDVEALEKLSKESEAIQSNRDYSGQLPNT